MSVFPLLPFCLAALLCLLTPVARSATSEPNVLSVTPSLNWYGDDGSWSAISIRVGSQPQWLDVLVNTRSSETWVVGVGGCEGTNVLCTTGRGGTFNSTQSTTWNTLGTFDLGANRELGNTGYAYYGLDSITYGSTGVTSQSILGIVNATSEFTWLGSFGLGIVPGNFNEDSPKAALSELVENKGAIGSHSYGYTAGAKYQQKGVPCSLTLGGYDSNRFEAHNVNFALNPSQQPQTFIDSVSVVSTTTSNNWTNPVQLLSNADQISVIIDSSTPYLWLPQTVCDQFAASLGLSYNDSLNLYTFDSNETQRKVLRDAQLIFTFGLLNLDSSSSTSVVNISLPYDAFDLQLAFPAIPNTTYGSPESTKYYFPLRRASDAAQYRIGRAFLQEAYIITDYERNTFSVHQAIHTSDPINNISIIAIPRLPSTKLSGPPSERKTLSTGAIVGIVLGVVFGLAIITLALLFYLRRRRTSADFKTEDSDPHRTTLQRLLGRRGTTPNEAGRDGDLPVEVGADVSHERFEMPAPLGPVELDSESGTLGGTTENGSTENSTSMSAYERARRKLELQRAAGARLQANGSHPEKTEQDASQVPHYRPVHDSPLVSPIGPEFTGSQSGGEPSPLSPRFPHQETTSPPVYRGINPENVVYAGRLPDNVQLPGNVPKVTGKDGVAIRSDGSAPISSPTNGPTSLESRDVQGGLHGSGSGNTQSEVSPISRGTESGRQGHLHRRTDSEEAHLRELLDPGGNRRRLYGEDLVHVPQPAENRYSWEEERISGRRESE